MSQKETTDLLNILAGGAFGALSGALTSLVVNSWLDSHKRGALFKHLGLEPQERGGCRVTARIHNGYELPLSHVGNNILDTQTRSA